MYTSTYVMAIKTILFFIALTSTYQYPSEETFFGNTTFIDHHPSRIINSGSLTELKLTEYYRPHIMMAHNPNLSRAFIDNQNNVYYPHYRPLYVVAHNPRSSRSSRSFIDDSYNSTYHTCLKSDVVTTLNLANGYVESDYPHLTLIPSLMTEFELCPL